MANTKRRKSKVTAPLSENEVEEKMGRYSELYNWRQNLQNEMNNELDRVRKNYEGKLAPIDDEMDELYEQMKGFAEAHKDEKFAKKKSAETVYGVYGFRKGPLSVKQLKGIKIKETIAGMKNDPELKNFLVIKENIDKSAIIDNADNKELVQKFRQVGLKLEQQEFFFVDLKKEEFQEA